MSSICTFFPSRDSEGRKLCKKVKVDPNSKRGGAELLHYKYVVAPGLSHFICFMSHGRLSVMCLFAEMEHSTQSTTGLQPLEWVLFVLLLQFGKINFVTWLIHC